MRFAPRASFAAALAAASLLWLLPGQLGVVAGSAGVVVVLAVGAADLVRLPPRRAFDVTREAPPNVGIGERMSGRYGVTSRWTHPFAFELQDRLAPSISGGVGSATVMLLPRSTVNLEFDVIGMARGVATLGNVGVRLRTRLGFMSVRYTVDMDDEMRVTPSLSGVRRYRLLAAQHRLDTAGIRALRRRGEGQGFAGLREYARGDDPRHIDWKASARRAKLITREYTIERSQNVITLIDAGRGMTQLAGAYSRFEHALSAALVLTDVAAAAGDQVGTLVFDDRIRAFVAAQRSRGALAQIREAFLPLQPTLCEPDYASAFRYLAAHQRKRALIVFFTDVTDTRASRALVAHLALSASRHLVLVVALRNDALFAAARQSLAVGATARLYERAAAEELILDREEALQRMRRAGAVVLDVSPRQMTAGVVNRYLEIKSRGAL